MSGSYMPMNHSYSPEYNEQEPDGYGQQYERYVSLTPSPSESFSDDMQNKTWFAPSKYSSFTISSNDKERNGDANDDFSSESSRERIHEPVTHPRISPIASANELPKKTSHSYAPINANKQNGGLFCFDLASANKDAKDKSSMSKSQSNISNTRIEITPPKDDKRQYSRSKTAELSASAQTMAKLRKLTSSKTCVTEISPSKSIESTINHLKDDNYDDMTFTVESSYDTPSKPKGILYSSRNQNEKNEIKKENSPLYKEVPQYAAQPRIDKHEPISKKENSPLFRDVPAFVQPKNFHNTRTISPMKSPKHMKPVEYPFPIEEHNKPTVLPKIDPIAAKKQNGFPELYQMPEVQVAPPRAQSILNLTAPQAPPKLLNVVTLTPSKFSVSDGLPLKQQSPKINGSTKSLFIETASLKNYKSTAGQDDQNEYKGRHSFSNQNEKSVSPFKDDFREIITGIISKKEAELTDELKSLRHKSTEEIQYESTAIEERLMKLKEREKSHFSEMRFLREKNQEDKSKMIKSPVIGDFKGFAEGKESNMTHDNEKSLDSAYQLRSKREHEWSKKKTELVGNTEQMKSPITEKSIDAKSGEIESLERSIISETFKAGNIKQEFVKREKFDHISKSEYNKEIAISKEVFDEPKVSEKAPEDSKISKKSSVEPNILEKALEEPKLTEKASDDQKLSEKTLEDPKLSEKTLEDPKLSEKAPEDPKLSEKAPEDPKLSEKAPEDSKLSEKVSDDPKLPEKAPEDSKLSEKAFGDSKLPEKTPEDSKLPEKTKKDSIQSKRTPEEPKEVPRDQLELTESTKESVSKKKDPTKETNSSKDKDESKLSNSIKKEPTKELEEKKKVPMKPKNSFLNSLYSKKIAPLMDSTEPSKSKKLEDPKAKDLKKDAEESSTAKPKNSLRNTLFSRSKTAEKNDKAQAEKKEEPAPRMSLRNSLKPTSSQKKDTAEVAVESSEPIETIAKTTKGPADSPPNKRSPRSKTARPSERNPLHEDVEKVEPKTNKEALAHLRTGLKSTKTENLAESINENLKRSPSMPSLASKHLRSKSSPREQYPSETEPTSSPAAKPSSLISARKSRLFGAAPAEKNGSIVSLQKLGSSASLQKSGSNKNSSQEDDEALQKPKEITKKSDDTNLDKKNPMANDKPAETNDSTFVRKSSLKSSTSTAKTSSTSQNSLAKQEDSAASKAILDEKKVPEQTKTEKPSILKKPSNFSKTETTDDKSKSTPTDSVKKSKTAVDKIEKNENEKQDVKKIDNLKEKTIEKNETNAIHIIEDVKNNDQLEIPSKPKEISSQELVETCSNSDNFISNSETAITTNNNEPKPDADNNQYSPEVNNIILPYKEKLAALEKEVKEMNSLFRNLNSICNTTSKDENIIKLNIGGTIYQTHKSTLTAPIKKYPDEDYEPHLLQLLVTGQTHAGSDENGAIFIDKNSLYFSYVMDYLRNNASPDLFPFELPRKEEILRGIIKESQYFKLHGLAKSANTLFKNLLIKNFRSSILNDEDKRRLIDLCNLTDRLELVYRASYHGFSAKEFHSKCDGISKTLTIVKTSKNNIFGGYTEAAWSKSKSYSTDRSSYIFSLVNKDPKDSKPVLMKCLQPERAIYNHPDQGPTFGSGYDFLISNNSDQNEDSLSYLGNSYKHPKWMKNSAEAKQYLGGSFHFRTTEIEVFSME